MPLVVPVISEKQKDAQLHRIMHLHLGNPSIEPTNAIVCHELATEKRETETMIRQTNKLHSTCGIFRMTMVLALVAITGAGCGINPKQPPSTPTEDPQPNVDPPENPTPSTEEPDTAEQPFAAVPGLYISTKAGNVVSYANPSQVNGNITPDTVLAGAQTKLLLPMDIVVNSANQLIVANQSGASVTTYYAADETNGNLAPDGNIQGAATRFSAPTALAINTDEDLLFVADPVTGDIQVFAGTSDSTFNGNIAPTRTIDSIDVHNPFGMSFGADDDLYVANPGRQNILVFANASSINGTVNATRKIDSPLFSVVLDVLVDANDTMYVVDAAKGDIYTFFDASTLNGTVEPDLVLDLPILATPTSIAVDSLGTAYITDASNNAVHVYDDIDLLNGTISPDRTIQGPNTQLGAPTRVFLVE